MPQFSAISEDRLVFAHRDLITLFREVIKIIDCTILETFRDEAAQNKAFEEGKSKLKFPQGKHNRNPSMAVDAAPYPINWQDTHRFYFFAGIVIATAAQLKAMGKMKYSLRWGGDWNTNNVFTDETFRDLVHFELVS